MRPMEPYCMRSRHATSHGRGSGTSACTACLPLHATPNEGPTEESRFLRFRSQISSEEPSRVVILAVSLQISFIGLPIRGGEWFCTPARKLIEAFRCRVSRTLSTARIQRTKRRQDVSKAWISRFSSSTVARIGTMVSRSLTANPRCFPYSSGDLDLACL